MALRWRNYGKGDLLCAAKCEPLPHDLYLDDPLHYIISAEKRLLIPDKNEAINGLWYWCGEVGFAKKSSVLSMWDTEKQEEWEQTK